MKKISKLLGSAALATGMFLLNPVAALAQNPINQNQININPTNEFAALGNITFASLVSGGVRLVLVIAALVFFFILVIGGIQWIVSGGDKTGVENARKRITNALIGLAIIFVAWAIITLIKVLFGVDIVSLNIPSFQQNQ